MRFQFETWMSSWWLSGDIHIYETLPGISDSPKWLSGGEEMKVFKSMKDFKKLHKNSVSNAMKSLCSMDCFKWGNKCA